MPAMNRWGRMAEEHLKTTNPAEYQAMKAAGIDMASVQVGGVDATQDALAAMQAGDLDVTVFQNAAAQGGGALDAALKLAKGETVGNAVWVPFELVTPDNIDNYLSKN